MEAAAAPALQALATQLAATDGVLHGVAAALVAAVGGELATTPLDAPERDLADAVSAKVAAGEEAPAPHGVPQEIEERVLAFFLRAFGMQGNGSFVATGLLQNPLVGSTMHNRGNDN